MSNLVFFWQRYVSYSMSNYFVVTKQYFPILNSLFFFHQDFYQTLMMHDIMEYMKSENFKYLVIKASHGDYYGFNLRVKMECIYALTIVSPEKKKNFMVIGWKVAKKLPKWVCNANGMVQAWVGQKSLKRDILRLFLMSEDEL